jgi:hypothetical protein
VEFEMKADRRMAATVAIAAFVLIGADAAAQHTGTDMRISTGLEYSTGKYGGADEIEELYAPLTFRAGFERIGFRLTLPWLSVTAPEETIVTDAGMEPLPGRASTVTESGLGDVVGSLTFYDLYVSDNDDFVVDATGKIKFGTADETKGLGTGENDYTLQFDAYQFFGRLSLQGTAGYRLRGDPPGVDLNDVFLAALGAAYLASANTIVGMYYDYRESAISGIDDIQEVSGFASFRLGRMWRMELYVFTGLTDSSTDFGGGILFSTDLGQIRVSDRQEY